MILPGMVVSVTLNTGQRSMFEYLMKPIARSFDRAFNER